MKTYRVFIGIEFKDSRGRIKQVLAKSYCDPIVFNSKEQAEDFALDLDYKAFEILQGEK